MKKHFYSHLVETNSLVIEINKLELEDHERVHLLSLVDSNLHHAVLDAILSELTEEDKKVFLTYLAREDNDKIWEHLNSRVDKIEEKIKKAAEDLKNALHEDIREVK